jgi:hypothetical protein
MGMGHSIVEIIPRPALVCQSAPWNIVPRDHAQDPVRSECFRRNQGICLPASPASFLEHKSSQKRIVLRLLVKFAATQGLIG